MLLFASKTDLRNIVNDNTERCCWKLLGGTLRNLKYDFEYILKKFKSNLVRLNPHKFELIVLGFVTDIKVKQFLDRNKIVKSSLR